MSYIDLSGASVAKPGGNFIPAGTHTVTVQSCELRESKKKFLIGGMERPVPQAVLVFEDGEGRTITLWCNLARVNNNTGKLMLNYDVEKLLVATGQRRPGQTPLFANKQDQDTTLTAMCELLVGLKATIEVVQGEDRVITETQQEVDPNTGAIIPKQVTKTVPGFCNVKTYEFLAAGNNTTSEDDFSF